MITAKKQARNAVTYAIRMGRLVPLPCEQCGDTTAEAHHDDYSRPLDIRWLCRPHHLECHGVGADPAAVVAAHDGGRRTLREVGDAFGISPPRVHQILAAHGIAERRYRKRAEDLYDPPAKKRERAA